MTDVKNRRVTRSPKVYYYAYEDVDEALDKFLAFDSQVTSLTALVKDNYDFKCRMFEDADGVYTIEVKVWKKLLRE